MKYINEARKGYDDPFTMVHHVDQDYVIQNCKPTSVVVWLALLKRASRSDMTCWPSIATIAKDASISDRTASAAIKDLEEHGVITIEKRMSDSGDLTTNLYTIHRHMEDISGGGESFIPTGGIKTHTHGWYQNLQTNHTQYEPDPEGELDGGKPKTQWASKIDDHWLPQSAVMVRLLKDGITKEQIDTQRQRFIDHHLSKGNTMKDWDRAFMNWMRNARDWGHLSSKTTPSRNGDVPQDGTLFRKLAEELRENGL